MKKLDIPDAGGGMVIQFDVMQGFDYYVDFRNILEGLPDWQPLPGAPHNSGQAADASLIHSHHLMELWAQTYGVVDPNGDIEPDGLDNLMEYALGGNPTNDDASEVAPVTFTAADGGTNWFYHVHTERTDDPALTVTIGTATNLVNVSSWDENDVEQVGAPVISGNFKTVTNRTEATPNAKFIKLQVERN